VHAVDAESSVFRFPSSTSRSPRASAIARIGSFTPVLECTHVSATARVRRVTASLIVCTTASSEAVAGSS
jgi:hypothetical protein